jgi:hypothetical protein
MRTMNPEATDARISAWRRARLVEAGFPLPLARRLANDPRFDLHALIDLTERGCAPELAARILAPLDVVETAA